MRFAQHLQEHLAHRHWIGQTCPVCSRVFYAKQTSATCASLTCDGRYTFRDLPARRRLLPLHDVAEHIRTRMHAAGIPTFAAVPVINPHADTLFIVAGIQAVYPRLYERGVVPDERRALGPRFLAQPSVRWKSWRDVGTTEGFTTSFVNPCILESPSSPDRHTEHLDLWLDVLSDLGLFAGHLSLAVKQTTVEVSGLRVWKIHIYYGGLELGDAAYIEGPGAPDTLDTPGASGASGTPGAPRTRVSDLGFGLERISWALSKGSYFDGLGPWYLTVHADAVLVDALRTLTLLVGSGGTSGTKAEGQRIRQLAKHCGKHLQSVPLESAVAFYHRFWSGFVDLPVSEADTVTAIRGEAETRRAQAVRKALGMPAERTDRVVDLDSEVWSLISRGADVADVRRAVEASG